MRRLIATAAAAVSIAVGTQSADACPAHIVRVDLPAVHVVQPYCTATRVVDGHATHRPVRHVTFALLGPYRSPKGADWERFTIEAHTVDRAHRWRLKLHHGWHRFTRRTATFTYDVLSLPGCADGPGPDPE